MDNLLPSTPHLLSAGRLDWPAKTRRISPWLGPRRLPQFEIWAVQRGRCQVRQQGRLYDLSAGQLFLFAPGLPYEVDQDPLHPLAHTFFAFHWVDPTGHPEFPRYSWPALIESVDPSFAEATSRRIVELLWEGYLESLQPVLPPSVYPQPDFSSEDELTRKGPFCPLTITIAPPPDQEALPACHQAAFLFRSLLNEVFYQLERQRAAPITGLEKHHRCLVSSVVLSMQQDPRAITNVAAIALQAGYSSDHFTRTFKKIMGCSPQQFLVHARINKARGLLLQSGLSIKEIADRLGYSNAFFFSRQFKALTGLSPTEYRHALEAPAPAADSRQAS